MVPSTSRVPVDADGVEVAGAAAEEQAKAKDATTTSSHSRRGNVNHVARRRILMLLSDMAAGTPFLNGGAFAGRLGGVHGPWRRSRSSPDRGLGLRHCRPVFCDLGAQVHPPGWRWAIPCQDRTSATRPASARMFRFNASALSLQDALIPFLNVYRTCSHQPLPQQRP